MKRPTGTRSFHLCISIPGLLKRGVKAFHFFDNDDGSKARPRDVFEEFKRLSSLGHTVFPATSECDNFDPFEHGCMGHDEYEDDGKELEAHLL